MNLEPKTNIDLKNLLKTDELKLKLRLLKEKLEDKISEIKEDLIIEHESVINNDINIEFSQNVCLDYERFLNMDFENWDVDYEFNKLSCASLFIPLTDIKDRDALPILINNFLIKYKLGIIVRSSTEFILPKEKKLFQKAFIIDFNKNITDNDIKAAINQERSFIEGIKDSADNARVYKRQ